MGKSGVRGAMAVLRPRESSPCTANPLPLSIGSRDRAGSVAKCLPSDTRAHEAGGRMPARNPEKLYEVAIPRRPSARARRPAKRLAPPAAPVTNSRATSNLPQSRSRAGAAGLPVRKGQNR